MRQAIRRMLGLAMVAWIALGTVACGCPTTAGPTAPIVSLTATLAPGEFRFLDVQTPSSTTQINLRWNVSSLTAPLTVRQIDPSCTPAAADACAALSEGNLTPRPAGVNSFGSTLSVLGSQTRVVVQNASAEETVVITLSIEPYRAGCT